MLALLFQLLLLLRYHHIRAILRLLVHLQTLFACHFILERFVRFADDFEGLLCPFDVVRVLVRVHQYREAAVLFLYQIQRRIAIQL
uniref:Putative secreted protein n=1 Tax=Anopheles triannulatus TaxID=58253 RepID=A0A2M4B4I8_9DIPT